MPTIGFLACGAASTIIRDTGCIAMASIKPSVRGPLVFLMALGGFSIAGCGAAAMLSPCPNKDTCPNKTSALWMA
jgi:hypothetical protein